MKITLNKLVFISGFMPLLSHAQEFNTSRQIATFALTITETAPTLQGKDNVGIPLKNENGTVDKTLVSSNEFRVDTFAGGRRVKRVDTVEYGIRMVTKKYSNREILIDLVGAGVIPQISATTPINTSIAGYSIEIYGSDREQGRPRWFLTKRGAQPISIDSYINNEYITGPSTYTLSDVTTTQNDTVTQVGRGSTTRKEPIEFRFGNTDFGFRCSGLNTYVGTYSTLTNVSNQRKYFLLVPGATRITGLVGTYNGTVSFDMGNVQPVVEGMINLAAGIPTFMPSRSAE